MGKNRVRWILSVGLSLVLFCPSIFAQFPYNPYRISSFDAVGSWFGRAVPLPGGTICPAGADGCPVPKEIVMVFTINDDGTFIGIDSNIFAGGNHTTAHGQWRSVWPASVNATFTLLQSSPAAPNSPAVFIGGFKNLFTATVIDHNTMQGQIDAYLYSYTDPKTGLTITDADGFPTPSPLTPASQCSPPGCVHLGIFTFKVKRVAVEQQQ